MKIRLIDLLDGKFRFYLKDNYRKKMFDNLKQKVGKWGDIAKLLKINPRNLFGIRRGWEYRKGIKLRYRTSAKWLSLIKSKSNLNLHEFQRIYQITEQWKS